MSELVDSQAPESFTWLDAWAHALTHPSAAGFQELLDDPAASTSRAFGFVAVAAGVGFLISTLLQLAFGTQTSSELSTLLPGVTFLTSLVCGLPLAIVGSILGLVISAGIIQWIAGMLGGTGSFNKLAYAFACFSAPITLVTGILSSAPIIFWLALPLSLYAIVLEVIATKAVNGFGYGKAVLTLVIPLAVLLLLSCLLTVAVLALLGPTIGNVFSNVIQTTTP